MERCLYISDSLFELSYQFCILTASNKHLSKMFKLLVIASILAYAASSPLPGLYGAAVIPGAVVSSHSSVVAHPTIVKTAPIVHTVHAAPVVHAVHAAPVVHAVHPVHAVHAAPIVHASPIVHHASLVHSPIVKTAYIH